MRTEPPPPPPPQPPQHEGSIATFVLLGLIMFLVGAISAMQPPVNALLAGRSSGLTAALISFSVGTAVLLVAALGTRSLTFHELGGTSWWWFAGGLMGVALVYASLRIVPILGSAGVLSAAVAGQLTGALLIDHFGWFGLPHSPISAIRLLGVALLVIGALLVVRR